MPINQTRNLQTSRTASVQATTLQQNTPRCRQQHAIQPNQEPANVKNGQCSGNNPPAKYAKKVQRSVGSNPPTRQGAGDVANGQRPVDSPPNPPKGPPLAHKGNGGQGYNNPQLDWAAILQQDRGQKMSQTASVRPTVLHQRRRKGTGGRETTINQLRRKTRQTSRTASVLSTRPGWMNEQIYKRARVGLTEVKKQLHPKINQSTKRADLTEQHHSFNNQQRLQIHVSMDRFLFNN